MKNLKISMKLAVSFLTVIILAVTIGVVGIYGLVSMGRAADVMYQDKALPLGELADAMDLYQRLRVQVRNAIIYSGNAENLKTVESDMNDRITRFEAAMNRYSPTIVTENGKKLFNSVMDNYNKIFKPGILDVLAGAKLGYDEAYLLELMAPTTVAANQIAIDLKDLIAARMAVMDDAGDGNKALQGRLFSIIVFVIIAAVIIATVFATFVSRMISKPLITLTEFMNTAGATGDITLRPEDVKNIEAYAAAKDETGQCIGSTANFIKRLNLIGQQLEMVAEGDLTVDVKLLSNKDALGMSLKKMADSLNDMFADINAAAMQVSAGSKQLATSSQVLSQGATEQAAAVEQLSGSIEEIANKTKNNAEIAGNAARLAEAIKVNAQKGSQQMDEMVTAVREINQASQNIGKVIKVIDDIAFQTNILALNAAVEAARAGQHGKGFAVVAEEVRNLATKSAEAAKDTGGLIESSITKAELGARIADDTASSLSEIVSGINESSQLVSVIARSSDEQSGGITQINRGIDQVSQVVQQNSATAEESSAASEEMSGQANMLESLVAHFKLRGSANAPKPAAAPKDLLLSEPMYTSSNDKY